MFKAIQKARKDNLKIDELKRKEEERLNKENEKK
jgi:hypothetical protein